MQAFLIPVHSDPVLFSRLLKALWHKEFMFFIHVDHKVDSRPYHVAAKGLTNIVFTKRRHTVQRKGWTQVASTLALLEEAIEYPAHFHYYSLISGQDYPIKQADYICDFFESSDLEYINYWRLEDRPEWLPMITRFHYRDDFTKMNLFPFKLAIKWKSLLHKLSTPGGIRIHPKDLVPHGGSAWWSLTDSCVRYILEFFNQRQEVVKFYKYTSSPCELIFQTIILNSPFAQRCVLYQEYLNWQRNPDLQKERLTESNFNFRYIDWNPERWSVQGTEKSKRGPAILNESDLEAISLSSALFARKMQQGISTSLLDKIDKNLLTLKG